MRAFLLYAAIVGLPVAGIISVLESGKDLQAAPALGGTWTVVIEAAQIVQGCAEMASVQPLKTLSIQQSGTTVTITLPDDGSRQLTGRIEWGGETPARIEASADAASVNQSLTRIAELRASLTNAAGQRALDGNLAIRACNAVYQQPFIATRQRKSGSD